MGKLKRKAKNKQIKLNTNNFSKMLKNVFLKGVITECKLSIDSKGNGIIGATDITNNLTVLSKSKLMKNNDPMEIGFGNIELIINFLKTIQDKAFCKMSGVVLQITHKKGKRKLNYLTREPELIATRIFLTGDDDDEEEIFDEIQDEMTHKIELTSAFIKDCLSYINMLSTKDTEIINNKGQLTFLCGMENDHQFKITSDQEMEEIKDTEDDDYSIQVNGEILSKVLDAIEPDDDNPPILFMTKEYPIIIKDKETSWAISPLTDIEE